MKLIASKDVTNMSDGVIKAPCIEVGDWCFLIEINTEMCLFFVDSPRQKDIDLSLNEFMSCFGEVPQFLPAEFFAYPNGKV